MNRFQVRALIASIAGVLVLFGLTVGVLSIIKPVFAGSPGALATTNKVPRFISSSGTIGDSSLSDDMTIVSTAEPTSTGSTLARSLINGPTIQSFAITDPLYTFGEINRREISGTVPTFPRDLFVDVIRATMTADSTPGTVRAGGLATEIDVTRTDSGAPNAIAAVPFECSAVIHGALGSDSANCIEALAGDVVIDAGNLILQGTSNYIFQQGASGFIAALGPIFAESAGTNGIDITAAPTNSIRIRNAAAQIDLQNAGTSNLNIYNSNSGNMTMSVQGPLSATTLRTGGVSGPVWSSGAVGAGAPGIACAIGDLFSNTTATTTTNAFYVCTSVNTWTPK